MRPVFSQSARQAANSINDWYSEKVNQAFHEVGRRAPSPTEALFAGIRNRGCLPSRQIIKATLDHCNPGTARLSSFLPKVGCKGGSFILPGSCGRDDFRRRAPVAGESLA
ncbi:hypothetical protein MPLA_230006 [Mesorhizobium sp. ORS 3359]|nr:hypothetical protein MPLA_230006 [Mesorhizobium sp. ORS 3359]